MGVVARGFNQAVMYPILRLYASGGAEMVEVLCADPLMGRITTGSQARLLAWSQMLADLAFEQLTKERFDVAAVFARSSADACRKGPDELEPHLGRALYYLGVSQARLGEPAFGALVESAAVFERNLNYRGMREMLARALAALAASVRGEPLPAFGAAGKADVADDLYLLLLTLCDERQADGQYAEAAPIAAAAVDLARERGSELHLARALAQLGHCHLHADGPALAELTEAAELTARHLPGHRAEHIGSEAHTMLSYALSDADRHHEAVDAARTAVDLTAGLGSSDQRSALTSLRTALLAAGREDEVPPVDARLDALPAAEDGRTDR